MPSPTSAPVAALAAQPLHLLQQLLELLRRDLVGTQAAREGLGLAEDHLVLARREVRREVGQAVHLLEQLEPLVAALEEAVEVGSLRAERGVLEHRGEVAGRARRRGPPARLELAPPEGRRPQALAPPPLARV